MKKLIIPIVSVVFLLGAAGVATLVAQVQQGAARVFIPGGQPVSEEQVRAKLQSEGWSGVAIAREGQYLRATGAVGGKLRTVIVDATNGQVATRIGGENEPDDDDDD
jgi:hypothetical protein